MVYFACDTRKKAVILLSGGLDSTGYMLLLKDKYKLFALIIEYGQKSEEVDRAVEWAKKYNIIYKILHLHGESIWNNALMQGTPENLYQGDEYNTQKKNLVEGRNPLFILLAGIYASKVGADTVITGFHKEPRVSPFKDGKTNYFKDINSLFKKTFVHKMKVIAPFHKLKREEIARRAYKIDKELFSNTTSCYEGGDCGKCVHCVKKREIMETVLSHSVGE